MTDDALATLCAAAYAPQWDFASGDVHARRAGNVVAFRGTDPDCVADWLRDLEAVPWLNRHIGWCHAGFLDGALLALPWLRGLPHPLVLTGHSLGGALAVLSAALLVATGVPVAAMVTFGAPRAGGDGVRDVLHDVPVRQYRHGHDVVPEVPWLPDVLMHVAPLTEIGSSTGDPIADHAIARYIAALTPDVQVAA